MSIFTESVWASVKPHTWKYRPRVKPINGILWHSTRGNQGYDGNTELNAFCNWMRSPNNYSAGMPSVGIAPYAGISTVGIGPGRIVQVVPDFMIPAWSSWQSDERKLSVEVAQSNLGQPIEPETIAECVRYAKAMAALYDFPLTRVFPTNDDTWVGMAGHEDTLQGKASGKSDPGDAFWTPFLAALNEEDSLSAEDIARIDRLERLLAANGIAKDLGKPEELTFGEDALVYAAERGWSAFLGLGLNQAATATNAANLKTHADNHTQGSGEAEHSHSQYVLKAELAEASD